MFQWLTRIWKRRELPGRAGERLAEQFLRREHRMRTLSRGWFFRRGELDLVMADGDTVVFVEVKTRESTQRGRPEEFVTHLKQQRLTRAALVYLKRRGWLGRRSRFDVVAITMQSGGNPPEIRYFPAAFEAQRGESFYG
jgi:putative endonuclease